MASEAYHYILFFVIILLLFVILILAGYIHRLLKFKRLQKDYYEYLDSLFVMIAHDIKSPIIALKEATAIIKLRLKNNDVKDATNFIEKFDHTIHKLDRSTQNVLNLGIGYRFSEKPCDVKIVMENVISYFSNTEEEVKKVNVQYGIQGRNMIIDHPQGIEIVIRNWVMNAVKHSHAHNVHINITQKGKYVVFVIQDDGLPIDNDSIKKITSVISSVSQNEFTQQKKYGLFLISSFLRFTKSTASLAIIDAKNTFTITTT